MKMIDRMIIFFLCLITFIDQLPSLISEDWEVECGLLEHQFYLFLLSITPFVPVLVSKLIQVGFKLR